MNKKKKKFQIVDITIHSLIEREKHISIMTLLENGNNLLDMRVTIVSVINRTLGTAPKNTGNNSEEIEIHGKDGKIHKTALLKPTKILRRLKEY